MLNVRTPDLLMEVAKFLYKGRPVVIWQEIVLVAVGGSEIQSFNPKLDGNTLQQTQALKVIVAADRLRGIYQRLSYRISQVNREDILTEALAGILEQIERTEKNADCA